MVVSNKAELVAKQLLGADIVKKQWGSAMYNVLTEGLVGGGLVDDTAALQLLVDKAIAAGRKAIFFPHGTNGQYRVTALLNADQVIFFGDNASFVGGYTGKINLLGETGTKVPGYVYLTEYGAIGDGVADDYQAFVDAIADCGPQDELIIPKPSVSYRISKKITIDKSIRMEGLHYRVASADNPTIVFDQSVLTGFELLHQDVRMDHLYIKLLSNTADTVAAIHLNNPAGGSMASIFLSNLFLFMNGSYGAGVKGMNCITSKLTNVKVFQGAYSFYFDIAGTSISFDSCFAMSNTKTGYYLQNYEYCSFLNCACDSPNDPDYAYHLVNSNGISFNGCGSEGMGKSMFRIQGGNGIAVIGGRAVGANHVGTAVASFSEQSDASNVSYIGCMESGQTGNLPSVVATGNLYPIMMNCNFTKTQMDANIYTDSMYEVRGSLKLGGMAIQISPFAGAASFIKNHNLFMLEQQLGVVKTDGSAIYGYFDADGTVIVRSFAALPAAAVAHRGKLARVEGGAGVADHIYMCRKTATDTYEWKQLDV